MTNSTNSYHIHEVLFMIMEKKIGYENKEALVKEIKSHFGDDAVFYACSDNQILPEDAYYFLIEKNKITVDDHGFINISSDMTMCNGHDHDH